MFHLFRRKPKQAKQDNHPLHAVTTGDLIDVTEVQDEVFSALIMGSGYAIRPSEDVDSCDIYSPVKGIVTTVFPSKHAVGIRMDNDLDILVHLGIDTVEMEGRPFESFVAIDDEVTPDTKLVSVDLTQLRAADKLTDMIVVCTNSKQMESMTLQSNRYVTARDIIGQIKAK